MLMAAGVEPAKSVFAHGFVSLAGEKMSKSRGNILDPDKMAGIFGADGLRYLLLREVPFDKDGDISTQILIDRYNSDLANELGNLFSRTLAMISKYLGGNVAEAPFDSKCGLHGAVTDAVAGYTKHMEQMEFSRALSAFWPAVQSANRFIEEKAPWALAKDETKRNELEAVFSELLAVLRTAGTALFPFMPEKMKAMLGQLGAGEPSLDGLPPSVSGAEGLSVPEPLFPRIQEKPEEIFKD
jgi:methionyl-tRNA synthetase